MTNLDGYENWLKKAHQGGPTDKQLAEETIPLLKASNFLRQPELVECDRRGHWLVSFWPPVPKTARPVRQPRQLKAGHAVATALIEKGGGRVRFRISKLTYGESRPLYRPKILCKDQTFTLPRVLFGAKFDGGNLRELKGSFRRIVPDSFRYEPTNDRQDLLPRLSLPIGKTLSEVFALCDKWYHEELEEMMLRSRETDD
jgi:hypothetical protein